MAPAVILIGCLLATMSCLTTAVNVTTANPSLNSTARSQVNSTTNPRFNSTTRSQVNSTTRSQVNSTANPLFNSTTRSQVNSTTNPRFNSTTRSQLNSTTNPPFNSTTRSQVNSTTNPRFDSTTRSQVNSTTNPRFNSTTRSQLNSTTNPPFNSTTRSQVNSTTNPPFNSTTNPPVNYPKGSCGNPDLCCSGLNNSCHRLNCFCDVACLRLHDCCSDFKPTCLKVNSSSNSTKPNNTLTLTGSCSKPTLCCSGTNYTCFRGCFCDEACKQLNDCCPDLNSTCIFNTTTAAPSFNSTANPSFNSTTNPPFNSTTRSQLNSTTNPPFNSTTRSQVNSTTNPRFNSTTRSQVNSTTNPPFNSTTNPPVNYPKGSCGNPDLCCSGLNNSCHRLNCFCDVACLRLHDCCSDFKPTCLTVNSSSSSSNSSNSTKPNNTLTLTGSCSEPTLCCSGTNYTCFRGCFCDEACKQLNDCCPDLNSTCIFNTTTAAPPFNSTANPSFNSTTNPPFNSTTRSQLNSTTNPPFNSTTRSQLNSTTNPPFNSTTRSQLNSTTNPPFNSTTNPPVNYPKGSCGNPDLCCSGLNSSCRRLNCFCDVACLRLRDCCPDFKPTCLTVNSSSSSSNSSNSTKPNNTLTLTGSCSEPTLCCSGTNYTCFRGCFCDEACKQLNDCCPDLNSTCIFNTTTAAPPFNSTANPPFNITTTTPFTTTAAPHEDVLTLLTNLEVEVLAEESSTEEERQAALRQVGAMLENALRAYNTDIYSFEVTRIEPVSPCD